MLDKLKGMKKALVSAVGVALTVLVFAGALPLPDNVQAIVGLAVAVLTPIATYLVRNAPPVVEA